MTPTPRLPLSYTRYLEAITEVKVRERERERERERFLWLCGILIPVVKCLECKKTSNTFDPLLDISLDIKNCSSLGKALQKSIQSDTLEGDNSYACP